MLEIYNEEVRDLLSLERGKVKRSLTLRERHDRTGFFGKYIYTLVLFVFYAV